MEFIISEIKKSMKNIGLVFLISYLISCTGQNNNDMQDFLKENGDYIDYEILPAHKKIQISLIKDRNQFESTVKQFKGQRIHPNKWEVQFDTNFIKAFPLYDFSNKSKLYQLSNGYIAVDQSEKSKANPFYLCKTPEDHKLVSQYLSIFYIEDMDRPIIQCSVHEHFNIKRFLAGEKLKFVKEKSSSTFKFFEANNGQCVYVRYNPNFIDTAIKRSKSFIDPEYRNEAEVYHSLTIYESVKVMNILGVLDIDFSEIDEQNFEDHHKRLFVDQNITIPVKIINSKNLPRILGETTRKDIPQKLKDAYLNSIQLKNGEIISQYSQYIFIYFKSEFDFLTYKEHLGHLKKDYEEEPSLGDFDRLIEQEIKKKSLSSNSLNELFEINTKDKTLKQLLAQLDKNINQYFFDNYFINLYFPRLVSYIGNIIISKEGGSWVFDKDLNRNVIVTKNNIKLDFIPELFEDVLRQKYTGFCPIEGIIGGMMGPKLDVSSSKMQ